MYLGQRGQVHFSRVFAFAIAHDLVAVVRELGHNLSQFDQQIYGSADQANAIPRTLAGIP
jgi:hypothetical protein